MKSRLGGCERRSLSSAGSGYAVAGVAVRVQKAGVEVRCRSRQGGAECGARLLGEGSFHAVNKRVGRDYKRAACCRWQLSPNGQWAGSKQPPHASSTARRAGPSATAAATMGERPDIDMGCCIAAPLTILAGADCCATTAAAGGSREGALGAGAGAAAASAAAVLWLVAATTLWRAAMAASNFPCMTCSREDGGGRGRAVEETRMWSREGGRLP